MPTKADLTITVPSQAPSEPLFIYSPQSFDVSNPNTKPPPSPTSSLKACFVRSRPTSTDFSESNHSFNDFSGLGDGLASSISSGTTSPPSSSVSESSCTEPDDFMDRVAFATEQWARAQQGERDGDRPPPSANSDARSIALSTLTAASRNTVVPVRIVRRSDAALDSEPAIPLREKEDQAKGDQITGKMEKDQAKRRRTWPSYKAIRRTVSNIVHRKEPPAPPSAIVSIPTNNPAPAAVAESGRIKSSASLFSRRRRATVSDNTDKASTKTTSRPSFMRRANSSSSRPPTAPVSALQHRAQLRRSRSFSGFTNVLSAIVDAEDEDLDEVTTEAKGVVEEIRRRWAFEEIQEDRDGEENAGYLFERCVE